MGQHESLKRDWGLYERLKRGLGAKARGKNCPVQAYEVALKRRHNDATSFTPCSTRAVNEQQIHLICDIIPT